jgi:AraC-like DNA-binding protein
MIFSFNEQEFRLSRDIPVELARYQQPGGKASAIVTEQFELIVQEFAVDESIVSYYVYRVDKKITLRAWDDRPLLKAFLVLGQDQHLEVGEIGKMLIREGQFNFIYSPTTEMVSHFDGGAENIILSIEFGMTVLEEWAIYFPLLAGFLKKAKAGEAAILLSRPAWITKEIQTFIYLLLHLSPEDNANQKHFTLMVNNLLFHLLYQVVQQQPASKYSHYEMERIRAARELIRKDIRYHFVIRDIAQKVGMNEFKLKNAFRELFGYGVYEYLRSERMQFARQLLRESGHNIKEIASLAGYRSVNSFIKAFKKMFGVTPGGLRKS